MKIEKANDSGMKIPCFITEGDIRAMLDRFDSGMADITTSNAVAIALKRELGSDAHIRVISSHVPGQFDLEYEGERGALPVEVSEWLSGCFRGLHAEPIGFEFCLPEGRITEELAALSERESGDHEASIAA